jgi:hypothetical protein
MLDTGRFRPHPSLEDFAGHPACGLDQLSDDLERFASCQSALTASLCSGRPPYMSRMTS